MASPDKPNILIVDDDEHLLKSFKRVLASRFDVATAASGQEGLEVLDGPDKVAIVISDYRMPGMDGVQFLAKVMVVSPDTVRILLTGHADLEAVIEAVNESNIFRLLTKPCPPKTLAKALLDALKLYDAVNAERELVDKTLRGSIAMLTDLASLLKPDVYGRISRILPYLRNICVSLEIKETWEIESAAMLSMIGFSTLPEGIVRRVLENHKLTPKQEELFAQHPGVAAGFISNIPRMEGVAEIIRWQEKHFDGTGYPMEGPAGDHIPLGSRILKVLIDFDTFVTNGTSKAEALVYMQQRKGWYDMSILGALDGVLGEEAQYSVRDMSLLGLEPNMVLAEDVIAHRGTKTVKLLPKGQSLTEMTIDFLLKYSKSYDVVQPLKVIEPLYCRLGAGYG